MPQRKGHWIGSLTWVTLLNIIVKKRLLEKVTMEKTPGGNEGFILEPGAVTLQAEGRPSVNTLKREGSGKLEGGAGQAREKREELRFQWEQGPGRVGPSWSVILNEKKTQ